MSTPTTPATSLGITPGEAILGDENDAGAEVQLANGSRINFDRIDPMSGLRVNTRNEMMANAHLVIDAHNTANACGMLPSQLLAKLREAEEALRWFVGECDRSKANTMGEEPGIDLRILDAKARKILNP